MIFLVNGAETVMDILGTSIFGSYEFLGFILVIFLVFLLATLKLPGQTILLLGGFFVVIIGSWAGGILKSMVAVVGVIFGVIIALTIWKLFKQGDQ
jgi:hypothetical protein